MVEGADKAEAGAWRDSPRYRGSDKFNDAGLAGEEVVEEMLEGGWDIRGSGGKRRLGRLVIGGLAAGDGDRDR